MPGREDGGSGKAKFNLRYSGVPMALIGLVVMVVGFVLSYSVMWEMAYVAFSLGIFLLTWGIWLAFLAKVDPTGRVPIGWIWSRQDKYPIRQMPPVANPSAINFCPNCGNPLQGVTVCGVCGRQVPKQ